RLALVREPPALPQARVEGGEAGWALRGVARGRVREGARLVRRGREGREVDDLVRGRRAGRGGDLEARQARRPRARLVPERREEERGPVAGRAAGRPGLRVVRRRP